MTEEKKWTPSEAWRRKKLWSHLILDQLGTTGDYPKHRHVFHGRI